MKRISSSLFVVALAALLFLLYLPGLSGGFLLDDHANLKALDRLQDWGFWAGLPSFLVSNVSGDLGRPIPLFTFALQYQAWPGDPAAFKAGNLAIHMLNACLVWAWTAMLWRHLRADKSAVSGLVPFLVALLWAAHPLLVSSVLYVVQRMALLAATFMLLGLLSYTHGRLQWGSVKGIRSGLWMLFGLALGTGLGVLSKENAALLPGLILILEYTLLRDLPRTKAWRWLVGLGALLPSVVLVGYLGVHFSSWILPGYELRSFSLSDRMMTEGRVLWDYLGNWVFPRNAALGLFHDDYVISRGLWSPPATGFALLAWLVAIVGAWKGRRRFPAGLFAIGGFLWAQALESGPLPLEIYFEHRNYFPGVFLVLGLGLGAMSLLADRPKSAAASWPEWKYGLIFLSLWLIFLAWTTREEAFVWGKPLLQAELWSSHHPKSLRALGYQAAKLEDAGFLEASGKYLKLMEQQDPGAMISRAIVDCRRGLPFEMERYQESMSALQHMAFSRAGISGAENLVILTENSLCQSYSGNLLLPALREMRANPRFVSVKFHTWVLEGRYWMRLKNWGAAGGAFDQALTLRGDVEVALLGVQAAMGCGDVVLAKKRLNHARAILNYYNPLSRSGYERDIARFDELLNPVSRETAQGPGFDDQTH